MNAKARDLTEPAMPGHQTHPVLEELSSILFDCLRLNRHNAKAVTHILGAIQSFIVDAGYCESLPARTDIALQPWQEYLATSMLLASSPQSLSIKNVAALCGVSTAQFTRAFKAQFGMTPQKWRLNARVERAKLMMAETSTSLTDIAVECGFAEQSHFNHTFLKVVGHCPGAWRRDHANSETELDGANAEAIKIGTRVRVA